EYVLAVGRGRDALERDASPRLRAFAHHYIGQALYRLARPDEALDHLRAARGLFERLGNPWYAAESLDWEAMALHRPEDPDDLATVLMKQGDLDGAEELLRSALDHFAAAGTERAQSHVLLSLGDLRQRQGRHGDALTFVQRAIELAERYRETLALASGHHQLA